MSLDHYASPETDGMATRILLVPVGATEQHGPHLPLTTDTQIASAVADRVSLRLPNEVVVGPAVSYGSSGEHEAFPGTVSIGAETTQAMLIELCRSATRTWRHVLLVSTHGGNKQPVGQAVDCLRQESRDVRAWSPSWKGDAHAGYIETSVMLALTPQSVRQHEEVVGATEPLSELLPALRAEGLAAVSSNGVLGDARAANAALGRELIRQAVDEIVRLISEWNRR